MPGPRATTLVHPYEHERYPTLALDTGSEEYPLRDIYEEYDLLELPDELVAELTAATAALAEVENRIRARLERRRQRASRT